MNLFESKVDCCGCTACANICPPSAISMIADEEGFLYPVVDSERCIACDLCRDVCAFQNDLSNKECSGFPFAYAAKHRSNAVRLYSSSGGVFTAISDICLKNDGVVYGVAFNEMIQAVHMRATNQEERDRCRGSKYVQSHLRDTFNKVEQDIQNERTVLFTGTPCQVAGLKAFLGCEYENLVTVDFVCHGTPSPLIFRDHIKYLQEKRGKRVVAYQCRSKVNGWHSHTEIVEFESGVKDYKSVYSQSYKDLFYSHLIIRPSCHNCQYANLNRPADITIGDFWGIENCLPHLDDNKGISLLLANTGKGKKMLDSLQTEMEIHQIETKDCLQPNLQHPTPPSPKRLKFWKEYSEYGYEFILKKYTYCNIVGRLKLLVKRIIGRN